jgi:hypothetical protein
VQFDVISDARLLVMFATDLEDCEPMNAEAAAYAMLPLSRQRFFKST